MGDNCCNALSSRNLRISRQLKDRFDARHISFIFGGNMFARFDKAAFLTAYLNTWVVLEYFDHE